MGPRIAGIRLQRSDRQYLDVQCALLLNHYSLPLVRKISSPGLGLNWNFCAAVRPARELDQSSDLHTICPRTGVHLGKKSDRQAPNVRPGLHKNPDQINDQIDILPNESGFRIEGADICDDTS